MRLIILRPSNNYGPWQVPDNLIPRFITLLAAGHKAPLYGSGHQRRCWVHVDDTARAVWTLVKRSEASGIFNIGGEELVNRQVVQAILNHLELDWSMVETVQDRVVHDRRYANHESRLRSLGYVRERRFADEIGELVQHYRNGWVDTHGSRPGTPSVDQCG